MIDKMIQATRIALLITAFTAGFMAWSLAGAGDMANAGLMILATALSAVTAFKN